MCVLNIIENDEITESSSSTTIKFEEILSVNCTFPMSKNDEGPVETDSTSIEIKLKGGEEPLRYGENPTLFRIADEDGLVSETSNMRQFEYDYMVAVSPGFEIEAEDGID